MFSHILLLQTSEAVGRQTYWRATVITLSLSGRRRYPDRLQMYLPEHHQVEYTLHISAKWKHSKITKTTGKQMGVELSAFSSTKYICYSRCNLLPCLSTGPCRQAPLVSQITLSVPVLRLIAICDFLLNCVISCDKDDDKLVWSLQCLPPTWTRAWRGDGTERTFLTFRILRVEDCRGLRWGQPTTIICLTDNDFGCWRHECTQVCESRSTDWLATRLHIYRHISAESRWCESCNEVSPCSGVD